MARFEVLRGVGLNDRQELLSSAHEYYLEPGEVIIHQGGSNDVMYLVVEGELGVHLDSVDSAPIALVGAGETVGELSLLDGSVASAHVVVREPTRVLALDEETFWTVTNSSHAFAVNLLTKLAERLRQNNATVSRNVKKRRQFEKAAMFDGLTGIHNRRWLDESLERLTKRYSRSEGASLSLALIDIDHFKSFNDRFGHDAGDHVLTAVAITLSQNIRPTDLVARYGGEEFVIIFPDTDLDPCMLAADRVRRAVADQELVTPTKQKLPNVTISVGVAQYDPAFDWKKLLKIADGALYRAKSSGRNRVIAG